MPNYIIILTAASIMFLSIFGTIAAYLFFRRIEQYANTTTILKIGAVVGCILNAIFLYWLVNIY